MYLVVVILILLVWAGYGIKEALTPPAPPIKDLDSHVKTVTQMGSQKERQKYLRSRKW